MSAALAAVSALVAEATRAASAYDGPHLEHLVGALCEKIAVCEAQDALSRDELLAVQQKLGAFVKLCEGLHGALFGVMQQVLAGAQPPTYAHAVRPSEAGRNKLAFSYGYLRRYG